MASTASSRTVVTVFPEIADIMPELKNSDGTVIVTFADSILPVSQENIGSIIFKYAQLLAFVSPAELPSRGFHVAGSTKDQQNSNRLSASIKLCNRLIKSKPYDRFRADAIILRDQAQNALLLFRAALLAESKKANAEQAEVERSQILPALADMMPIMKQGRVIVKFDPKRIPVLSDTPSMVDKKLYRCIELLVTVRNLDTLHSYGIHVEGASSSQREKNRFRAILKICDYILRDKTCKNVHKRIAIVREEALQDFKELQAILLVPTSLLPDVIDIMPKLRSDSNIIVEFASKRIPKKSEDIQSEIWRCIELLSHYRDCSELVLFGIYIKGSTPEEQAISRLLAIIELCKEIRKHAEWISFQVAVEVAAGAMVELEKFRHQIFLAEQKQRHSAARFGFSRDSSDHSAAAAGGNAPVTSKSRAPSSTLPPLAPARP